ncbi:hypothetical protein MMUC44124_26540 [Mycolicibacterium mucogenicum DSM 44124]|nr:hypothetical protein MMUC44124_26540 [Mycolicibacterium mucogenicum DSM 44124]
MAYASIGVACWSTMDDGDDHVHRCEFAADHTDWDHDGTHQCECGADW